MNFKNQRFITKGAAEKVNPLLQSFMWQCIDDMTMPKDYLQKIGYFYQNKSKINQNH